MNEYSLLFKIIGIYNYIIYRKYTRTSHIVIKLDVIASCIEILVRVLVLTILFKRKQNSNLIYSVIMSTLPMRN